jgi:hypothetical protein
MRKALAAIFLLLLAGQAFAAGPDAIGSPWGQAYPNLYYNFGGVVLPSTVPGGPKGVGTINAEGLYVNGVPVSTSSATGLPAATTNQLYIGSGAAGVADVASTLPTASMPALTGDCTNTAGALALTCLKTSGVAFGALATNTPGAGVATALGYALNNPLGLPSATSPIFGGIAEFTGSASVVNLQSPPANIFAVSAGGATLQVCYLTGCVANDFLTAVYGRWTTALDASKSEYLFSLDSVSNTGLSPNWQATTPYGAAWATGHLYPANSYVTHGGNLYVTAISGTSGATAPTCSGGATPFANATCSDGAITWVYLSATPTTFYVVAPNGNLYSTTTLTTSGATAPTCGSGTCSDGSITWSYVNNGIVANKVNAFSSWVTGPNTANGTWNWAFDSVWNADNPFMVNVELDVEKIGQLNCAAGVINCYNIYMSGNTDHQITAEIAMSAGTLANPAAYWGMLIAGPYLATVADIEIDDSAPYGLLLNNLYPGTHSTAAIADFSTSPLGFYATGTYSLAPFYSSNAASTVWGLFLGATAASGSSIASQAVALGYFNASGVAHNMTWTVLNNVMYLGSTETKPVLNIGGSLGLSCSGAPTLSFATTGGIVTHC